MFTEFGVRVPFSDFQQRLLNRASVAPSQLHPNAWSAIRGFELVIDFLRLPQDPEVFLYLFTLFSPNTEGKTKKGYMLVRPGKYRKIFLLYEDSFHDFKGRFFKIFPVGEHRPFWLSLEGQGRFPPYWSRDTGMDYVPVTYKGLNADQKDTADILVKLFSERNLKPKTILSNPSEAREAIVDMARKEITLERLRRLICPGSSQSVPAVSVPAPGPSRTPVEPQPVPTDDNVVFLKGGSSNVGGAKRPVHEALNLQRIEAEKEKLAAEQARVKAEGDLKSLLGKLEVLEKEKAEEAERRKNRESKLEGEIQDLRKSVSDEKARADKAEREKSG
ncbi:hypothetical protein PIB30_086580 [Stylosanthes scabra]|uniref:Transposase (putative) gypsy type domain-containing protein n=1 Tax=Stylosanthes scabra TaxID=79078 RepID=A0ABU6SUI4_9FABA|nr:hypothetical protein [Stylosanthes scabra]